MNKIKFHIVTVTYTPNLPSSVLAQVGQNYTAKFSLVVKDVFNHMSKDTFKYLFLKDLKHSSTLIKAINNVRIVSVVDDVNVFNIFYKAKVRVLANYSSEQYEKIFLDYAKNIVKSKLRKKVLEKTLYSVNKMLSAELYDLRKERYKAARVLDELFELYNTKVKYYKNKSKIKQRLLKDMKRYADNVRMLEKEIIFLNDMKMKLKNLHEVRKIEKSVELLERNIKNLTDVKNSVDDIDTQTSLTNAIEKIKQQKRESENKLEKLRKLAELNKREEQRLEKANERYVKKVIQQSKQSKISVQTDDNKKIVIKNLDLGL